MRLVPFIFLGSLIADFAAWVVLGWPASPDTVITFTLGALALAVAQVGD